VDPAEAEPEYAVQCQENGFFFFASSAGPVPRFRRARPRQGQLYQPVEDEIGVACRDAVLSVRNRNSDSLFSGCRAKTLWGGPVARMVPPFGEMAFQFSEPVTLTFRRAWLRPTGFWRKRRTVDPSDPRKVVLLTGPQISRKILFHRYFGRTRRPRQSARFCVAAARIDGSPWPTPSRHASCRRSEERRGGGSARPPLQGSSSARPWIPEAPATGRSSGMKQAKRFPAVWSGIAGLADPCSRAAALRPFPYRLAIDSSVAGRSAWP